MIFAAIPLVLASLTTADAVQIVLNTSNSVGVAQYRAARAQVEREAAAGKPLQQFVIGLTTDDRELATRYLNAARDRIRASAERNNNAMAWYLLSMENNDLKMLRKAADGGNVQALNALGAIVTSEVVARPGLDPKRVESILNQSFRYFVAAADKRDPNAFVNVGACYLGGLGCKQDRVKAFRYFRAAAEAGHPEGMDNVSACYQFGHGVEPDAELSLYWAMRGRAARGDEAAAKWLKGRK